MPMWYNDSMISSSKRRAKRLSFRFSKTDMRIASFVYNQAATISEVRTLTHTHKNLLMLRSVTAKGYNIATYAVYQKK